MAKKTQKAKKVANRGPARKASAFKKAAPSRAVAPRVTPRAAAPRAAAPRPAPRAAPRATAPSPVKLDTTSKTVTTPALEEAPAGWSRILGHWISDKEVLEDGCEWYDSGNEGLKQRPITED